MTDSARQQRCDQSGKQLMRVWLRLRKYDIICHFALAYFVTMTVDKKMSQKRLKQGSFGTLWLKTLREYGIL